MYPCLCTTTCCTGLQSLQAAILGGPPGATSALNATWSTSKSNTPCHDIDPNCQLCPFSQPSALCGTLMPNSSGPPSYYCTAQGVSCDGGRVNVVNISWSGLVLSQLPSGLGQLVKLQELGEFGMTLSSWSGCPQCAKQQQRLAAQAEAVQCTQLLVCPFLRCCSNENCFGTAVHMLSYNGQAVQQRTCGSCMTHDATVSKVSWLQ